MSRSQPISKLAKLILLAVFLLCAGVLAYAYYLQHFERLDPCPWCVAQRVLFLLIGLIALIGLVHGRGAGVYGASGLAVALAGVAAAGYQIWLQSVPERASSCMGGWLEKTLDTLRLGKLWPDMLQYDGFCTLAPWNFLGLSIPEWSLVCFTVLSAAFLWILFRRPQSRYS